MLYILNLKGGCKYKIYNMTTCHRHDRIKAEKRMSHIVVFWSIIWKKDTGLVPFYYPNLLHYFVRYSYALMYEEKNKHVKKHDDILKLYLIDLPNG